MRKISQTRLESRQCIGQFQRQFMMAPAMFDELQLSTVGLRLGRANSNRRQAIDPGQTYGNVVL